MNKRATVGLLLSVALIAALAMLPRGLGALSDLRAEGTAEAAPMQSVTLAFDSDGVDAPGYMLRKLALEGKMLTIPIQPEQAQMSEDGVLDAASASMGAYVEEGLFQWFDASYVSIQPYLGIDPENKNNNMIFWTVACTFDQEPYQSLFLHIDDETGRALFINYETCMPERFEDHGPEGQTLLMEGFIRSFFGQLELLDDQMTGYRKLLSREQREKTLTEDVTCVVYTLNDGVYGQIQVEFYITQEGFRVYFPGAQVESL